MIGCQVDKGWIYDGYSYLSIFLHLELMPQCLGTLVRDFFFSKLFEGEDPFEFESL